MNKNTVDTNMTDICLVTIVTIEKTKTDENVIQSTVENSQENIGYLERFNAYHDETLDMTYCRIVMILLAFLHIFWRLYTLEYTFLTSSLPEKTISRYFNDAYFMICLFMIPLDLCICIVCSHGDIKNVIRSAYAMGGFMVISFYYDFYY